MSAPRIALISAVPAAIAPAAEALRERFPAAVVWNLLDDRLLADADERGGPDGDLYARMERLVEYAVRGGADGVLLTCSLYGAVARRAAVGVPVLAPDQAAFDELCARRFGRVLVVASFAGARDDSAARLRQALRRSGSATDVRGVAVPGAVGPRDVPGLVAALAEGCAEVMDGVGAVFLAQFSLAPAARGLAAALGVPVVSGPVSAADALRSALGY
ncbi:hypothetical protein [Streptantibioticus cattleyicolor]|uniref:Asp/Glu racemase n=1 Tax=Streptantibioticus cattleyicolor (strain ATCC 35852 / DSM 46488 / JCM 4925 / NBRC 14057 / NRRL 8057) TaxID=1003195 RepID=F8JLI7_STREN|nr:hypothetical protein [Streptantibioticus cattleyicolor]AEW98298.1 Asp/Glu racemase [Streptantibioticus cattleyicolor NRRL 8057 = DSM 46488]CCB72643.1 conserved exported protein of unknown function [Streptantibioticus cattleyicolor NRRL 8057 = DSM 46488]